MKYRPPPAPPRPLCSARAAPRRGRAVAAFPPSPRLAATKGCAAAARSAKDAVTVALVPAEQPRRRVATPPRRRRAARLDGLRPDQDDVPTERRPRHCGCPVRPRQEFKTPSAAPRLDAKCQCHPGWVARPCQCRREFLLLQGDGVVICFFRRDHELPGSRRGTRELRSWRFPTLLQQRQPSALQP